MSDVTMPRLSDSMEEGTILRWLRSDGDEVARGDELVEVETDKATMTYEADSGGVLSIVAAVGETLPVGAVIARLGAEGEAPAGRPQPGGPLDESRIPRLDRRTSPTEGYDDRVRASPVARRVAKERGLELHDVHGTGPGGRIVRADVEERSANEREPDAPEQSAGEREPDAPERLASLAAPSTSTPAAAAAPITPPTPAHAPGAAAATTTTTKGTVTSTEPTRAQGLIARRMAESRATVPSFEVRVEVDAGEVVALRAQLKEQLAVAPSLNDLVVKACALALREHPHVNGAYRDGRFERFSRVNVGVAVAGDGVLVVPTIFDADAKPVATIAAEARALAEKVRAGTITPPEVAGGTFTVSNLGSFGVTSFTAVINPPQAAILAVGAATARPVVRDGAVVAGHTMDLTLACDHRILYGADAARFLTTVRGLLERPLTLLVA